MASENKHRLFPAQEESEKILIVLRKHWFSYAIFWIVTLFMLIPIVAVVVYWTNNAQDLSPVWGNLLIIFGSMYALLIFAMMIYGFVDYYLDVYLVTDKRIVAIVQNGFFKREIAEVNLHQIQDVNAKVDGVAATLFHFGNVYLQTAGELPNFIFESIPHPYEISKKIVDLHQAHVRLVDKAESENISNKMVQIWNGESYNESEKKEQKNCFDKETCDKLMLQGIKKTQQELSANQSGELHEGEVVDIND